MDLLTKTKQFQKMKDIIEVKAADQAFIVFPNAKLFQGKPGQAYSKFPSITYVFFQPL